MNIYEMYHRQADVKWEPHRSHTETIAAVEASMRRLESSAERTAQLAATDVFARFA